jgi:hypothetical protein
MRRKRKEDNMFRDTVYKIWDAGCDLLFEGSGSVLTEQDLDDELLFSGTKDVTINLFPTPEPLVENGEVHPAFVGGNCNWRSSLTDLADQEDTALVYGEAQVGDITLYIVGQPGAKLPF